MGFNLEMKNHLENKDESGTAIYSVGDSVVCEAGGKRYIGKITSIGYYQNDGEEAKPAIYIDTSKTKTSYSGEVVMAEDIILSFGNKVHVLEPPEIQERIVRTCREIQMEYGG